MSVTRSSEFPGFVVFCDFGGTKLDYRLGGCALPAGSIPLYVEGLNHKGLYIGGGQFHELQDIILKARYFAALNGGIKLIERDFVAIAKSDWAIDAVNQAVGHWQSEWIVSFFNAGMDIDAGALIDEIDEAREEHEYDRATREYLHRGSNARQLP